MLRYLRMAAITRSLRSSATTKARTRSTAWPGCDRALSCRSRCVLVAWWGWVCCFRETNPLSPQEARTSVVRREGPRRASSKTGHAKSCNSDLTVEMLADPYGDEGSSTLSPLPPVGTSPPSAGVGGGIRRCIHADSELDPLGGGSRRTCRVDCPGSLTSAWEATMSHLYDLGDR